MEESTYKIVEGNKNESGVLFKEWVEVKGEIHGFYGIRRCPIPEDREHVYLIDHIPGGGRACYTTDYWVACKIVEDFNVYGIGEITPEHTQAEIGKLWNKDFAKHVADQSVQGGFIFEYERYIGHEKSNCGEGKAER